METVIKVKNISKKYKIAHHRGGYVALRDVIANIFKNPFTFLKTKSKQIIGMDTLEEFWALKDVNFEVNKGDIIGIIGRNGAGKSTLLKILSQITPPTEGEIKITGRVGSLLEVGTGFHPELTGRENIFLNGAILGMKKVDIVKKFDEIVKFADIEKFLDTPVKYYSSGMYVRLAFSVAAHMEPDILIVDEVLAVGDSEFQKKCLGKMEDITKNEGRTILFVSHNLTAISRLCNKCILLEKGKIELVDTTEKVLELYLNKGYGFKSEIKFEEELDKDAFIQKIQVLDKDKKTCVELPISEKFFVKINFKVNKKIQKAALCLIIHTNGELLLYSSNSDKTGLVEDFEIGNYEALIEIPAFLLNVGNHIIDISIQYPFVDFIDRKENIPINITDKNNPRTKVTNGNIIGMIANQLTYHIEKK